MTIEEKAKAYDEALKRAREVIKNNPDFVRVTPKLMEEIFPELEESEDERMRSQTLKVLNYYKNEENSEGRIPTEINECIAWLKKQGAQKSIDDLTPQEAMDIAVNKCFEQGDKPTLRERYENIAKSEWFKKTHDGISVSNDEEPKWSEEDEVGLGDALWAIEQAKTIVKNENEMGNLWYAERWLKSIKQRLE